jgi:hypothetical protein
MAEFKLGRIRFVWKNDWATGTTYYKDDIVAYGGKTFLCVVGHTAAADFYTDLDNVPTKWNQFADGVAWRGEWTDAETYAINDIVKYGGYVYICNEGHTADTLLENDQSKWDLFAESFDWQGEWATSTYYKVNDLVKYGGLVYICNTSHTSAATSADGLEVDQSNWDVFSKGNDWKGDWTTSTRYKVNDIVKYGGYTYVCNEGHTASATASLGLEADQSKWDEFNEGIEYTGVWDTAVRYKANDLVKYGGGVWICINDHTSSSTFAADVANWNQFVEGIEFEGEWANLTVYQPGDIVRYGGNSYISKTNHEAATAQPPSINTTDWDLFSQGFRLAGDYDISTAYKIGEVVRVNGYTYVATADSTGSTPPSGDWSLLNQGIAWQGDWSDATDYNIGDAVKFGSNSYLCILHHTSSSGVIDPAVDITGTYWNLLAAGNEESVLTTLGDLVYYGGAGPTRLPAGDSGQTLTVVNGVPAWRYFGRIENVFYVAPHGVDAPSPTYGLTIDQPFKTVRYATEIIENGYKNLDAAYLLKQNRTFIQTEIVEWTDYQIANDIAPFTSAFSYDKETCQRDMGLLVDALVYDLTHDGNAKSIAAAQAYFTALGVSYITGQEDETIASINYGLSLISAVLGNTAPAANYQALNGISAGNRVKQIIDISYTAESGSYDICASLAAIVTDAIAAGDTDNLPDLDEPNYTINIKTGLFEEVLPIIVPARTAVVGDELRSTRVSPAGKLVATTDAAKSVATLTRLKAITADVISNSSVVVTPGNGETQDITSQRAGSTGSATAVSRLTALVTEMKDILNNGLSAADAFSLATPTGFGSSLTDSAYAASGNVSGTTTGYDNAVAQIQANKDFIVAEITAWIAVQVAAETAPFTAEFVYDEVACARDVGYILDAIVYDLTYGGNYQTRVAADAYYTYGSATFGEGEKEETLAAYTHLKSIISDVILENAITPSAGNGETQDTSGTAGSAASAAFAQERVDIIYDTIDNDGTLPAFVAPATSWVSAELVASRAAFVAKKTTIQTDAVQHIIREYPTLNFNTTTCSRDVGYIVDALGYDIAFNSNFASIKAAMAYYRGTSSAQLVVAEQKEATALIFDFIQAKSKFYLANGAEVIADTLWSDLIGYVTTGTEPIIVGTNVPTTDIDVINGAKILLLNKEFFASEATAYIADTYSDVVTATSSTGNILTITDTSWMALNDPIRFTGTAIGGVSTGVTYYVKTIESGTDFTISATIGGTALAVTNGSGSMGVAYYYAIARCENDVRNYIEAIATDMMYTGNYKSVYAAKYYRNALTGSKLEDMYLVRNGCGVRNMTVLGLDGTSDGDQTGVQDPYSAPNEFGTRRPNAGAYVSLDPGWGPNDDRVWITTRSTYVQNVTTFGSGATGQKIDGALHAGGNDSIVSNDFTQVISDGIGAWITNLGRAELVSVFSYYAHIGYLAENGGKIRATNGNNSYGDFGAVAEGVDVTEVPITGFINNRASEADVRNVMVDGNNVLAFEFRNAGLEYTTATYSISGAGASVAVRADEFRDGAVFQVRLTDPGDSSGPGGVGYITAQNSAQGGNTTQITIAAADTASSAAYVGMRLDIVAGTGAGQYGYIDTYNAASKVATIKKMSTGEAGWDHIIPGEPIESSLDITTAYEITPRLSFTPPPFTVTTTDLPTSQNWTDVVWGNGEGTYDSLSPTSTSGVGSLATFNVTRKNGVYNVTINAPGVLYEVGDTITIVGTALGGTTPENDLVMTVTFTTGSSGAIQQVTTSSTPITPKHVAIASGTDAGAYSLDGITWTAMTMPVSQQWTAVDYGTVSGIGYYVAVARESSQAAYSRDGINWTTANIGDIADWCDVAYGDSRFVAIAESDSSTTIRAISNNGGASWSNSTIASGAKAIAYGSTQFVVIEGNFSNSVAYSANGTSWTVTTLPANDDSAESNWVDLAYGNNRFVAIADNAAMAAYSFDGATWYKSNLPAIAEWTSVRYGQGLFYATASDNVAASSEDGLNWTLRDVPYATVDITVTKKDINDAYAANTLPATGTWSDMIYDGSKFVAIGYDATPLPIAAYSTDGQSWTAGTLPASGGNNQYTTIGYNGSNLYVAIIGGDGGTNDIATSTDGITFSNVANAMASNSFWEDIVWGEGKFVAMKGDASSVNTSSDGTTWTNYTISGGSSENSAIAYGDVSGTGYFVIVSGYSTGSQIASYSTDGQSWTSGSNLPSSDVWSSVAYGNELFVAVAGNASTTTTKAAWSNDGGATWTAATMPGAAANWYTVVYGGGAFTAFAYNSTRTAYSVDGATWVEGEALTQTANWTTAAYGGQRNVVLASGSNAAENNRFELDTNHLTTSSGTASLNAGDIIKIVDDSAGAEVFGGLSSSVTYYVKEVVDANNFTISATRGGAVVTLSTGSGSMEMVTGKFWKASSLGNYQGTPNWVVIADGSKGIQNIRQGARTRARSYVTDERIQEIWINEPGSGYVTAPTMTITDPNNTGSDATHQVRIGNGALGQPTFTNRGINYSAASAIIAGDGYADNYQISSFVGFTGLTDVPRPGSNVQIAGIDDVYYKLVNVTNLIDQGDTYSATLQISPPIQDLEAPEHLTGASIRRRFSQVRLTGHDFLDIGTGNFTNTNYPGLPLTDPIPENETVDSNGGRVFYTSTDQDGNFRVGGLFNVEQSTGVATLNADAFNIAGLNELSLGSVALGGSGATINEFSTDPFFTQDSDNVIPTQRAIKAYITSQIGGGGSSLNVNTLTAGVVYIAGQTISTTTSVQININTKVNFKGGIAGDALVLNYFLLNN